MEQFCSVSNGISHFSVTGHMKKGRKRELLLIQVDWKIS